MGKDSAIAWCDATWQVVAGCSMASPGCLNCYSARLLATRLKHLPWAQGLAEMTPRGPHWTGKVVTRPDQLSQPLRWKKPLAIFVGDRGDLFHPAVPFEFIAAVYGVMAACPQHTFLTCTKRPKRRLEFFKWVAERAPRLPGGFAHFCSSEAMKTRAVKLPTSFVLRPSPLDNIWEGVTAENQPMADTRIPLLLQTPAAHRWVSLEPLLERIDLEYRLPSTEHEAFNTGPQWLEKLDTVIVGGESGPGARPCCDEWIESIVDQCQSADVPCFVKQWGSNPVHAVRMGLATKSVVFSTLEPQTLKHRSGGDPSEWPYNWPRDLAWRKV